MFYFTLQLNSFLSSDSSPLLPLSAPALAAVQPTIIHTRSLTIRQVMSLVNWC